jgi:HK97 gp10 family phage protein
MKFKIKVSGDKEIIAKIKKFGEDGLKVLAEETSAQADVIRADAQSNVRKNRSIDTSNLINNIRARRISDLEYLIVSYAPYSAYVEFGTGGHEYVVVPDELKEIADQYRGTKGRIRNMPAKPFMYPALLTARKTFPEHLKIALKKLIKNNG